jgi:hypothetical protein
MAQIQRLHSKRKWMAALLAAWMTVGLAWAAEAPIASHPAKVEVRQAGGKWRLYVNGKQFFINGAGLEFGDQEKLAAAGGNSFRSWRPDNGQETGQQVLDRALKNGLYVAMGLDVEPERNGFDYSNSNAVAGQLAKMKVDVLRLKNHPALLFWDIGNELNLNSHNPKVWDAVNDISKMIHQLDPNHPTTTSLAGINRELVDQIKSRLPDIDFLCVQSYADIVNLPAELRDSGWTGPYVVTEWGATGHWECGKTQWGAPIEDNSSVKAGCYRKRYEVAIASDTTNCLGSYVFLWGQKQERTPTWYGMFLNSGETTETVDVMQYVWTGQWPAFRSPQLKSCSLAGKTAQQNVHLLPGQNYAATVSAQSPAGDPLTYSWEIMEESSAQSIGGDLEKQPSRLPGLVQDAAANTQLRAPTKPGAYRLFVYVIDRHQKAAYANIPFYVDDEKTAGLATH